MNLTLQLPKVHRYPCTNHQICIHTGQAAGYPGCQGSPSLRENTLTQGSWPRPQGAQSESMSRGLDSPAPGFSILGRVAGQTRGKKPWQASSAFPPQTGCGKGVPESPSVGQGLAGESRREAGVRSGVTQPPRLLPGDSYSFTYPASPA